VRVAPSRSKGPHDQCDHVLLKTAHEQHRKKRDHVRPGCTRASIGTHPHGEQHHGFAPILSDNQGRTARPPRAQPDRTNGLALEPDKMIEAETGAKVLVVTGTQAAEQSSVRPDIRIGEHLLPISEAAALFTHRLHLLGRSARHPRRMNPESQTPRRSPPLIDVRSAATEGAQVRAEESSVISGVDIAAVPLRGEAL